MSAIEDLAFPELGERTARLAADLRAQIETELAA